MLINLDELETASPVNSFMYTESPPFITGTLRDYQVEGVNWMLSMLERNTNCILADEMGLGKTLQTITFLAHQTMKEQKIDPHLLIVPKSILINWKNEFNKFCPKMKVLIFHALKDDIPSLIAEFNENRFDVVVTTYEMVIRHKRYLKSLEWCTLTIDEAHRIKNEQSQLSVIVRKINCEFRMLLTGTPLQNNIRELWALLNFLKPSIFDNVDNFEAWVSEGEIETDVIIEKLRRVLNLFFLRREKSEVERTLLPKKIINLYPGLSEVQRECYKNVLAKDVSKLGTTLGLNNLIMQLRKVCSHPYLLPNVEEEPYTTGEHIVTNSGKLMVMDKLLKLKAGKHQILIFCQFQMCLDILEDYCMMRQYSYVRIDGSTSTEDRANAVDTFMSGGAFIFLLSTRAGGLGLNLTAADTVIFFDNDWNPQVDLQAMDRAHRIGQSKQVSVYRLVAKGTVDEKIIFQALKKLKLGEVMKKPGKAELMEIMVGGTDFLQDAPQDIEELIKEGEKKTEELESQLGKANVLERHECNLYEFEGQEYLKKKFIAQGILEDESKPKMRKSGNIFSRRPTFFPMGSFQFYPDELNDLQAKEEELYYTGEVLSEEDKALKMELVNQGFSWTKRDFSQFIKGLELYDKNPSKICKLLEKLEEEVARYIDVFFKRYTELPDYERLTSLLNRASVKRERNVRVLAQLKSLFDGSRKRINYAANTRSKIFNEECDHFLLKTYYEFFEDIDVYERIRWRLKRNENMADNYWLRTLKASEIQKRLHTLCTNLLRYRSSE